MCEARFEMNAKSKNSKGVRLLSAALMLAILLLSFTAYKAFADDVVVKGTVRYDELRKGRTDILIDLPKEEAKKYKQYNLEITKSGDEYFWASNGNKKLVRLEMPVVDWKGNKLKHIVFSNPDGYGQIFIRDDRGKEDDFCSDLSYTNTYNYVEYRLNERGSGFDVYSGYTKPFPYPVQGSEKCRW